MTTETETTMNQMLIVENSIGLVEARIDLDVDAPTPPLSLYGFVRPHYILRGNYPDVYRGWFYNAPRRQFRKGAYDPLPVNPKAPWSEELEDARTFKAFKDLLMQDEAFLTLVGYMDAAHRFAHDSIRGSNAARPPEPEPAPEGASADESESESPTSEQGGTGDDGGA